MTDQNYTDITFILDRSGSMSSMDEEPVTAFDAFVEDQKKVDGRCTFTTILFDHEYRVLHDAVPIERVESIRDVYNPRGTTALLDALGTAIVAAGERFASQKEDRRPGKVVFVVLTDGMENSSKDWKRAAIADLVKKQTDQWGWSFVYLGAAAESFTEAASIQFGTFNVGNYDASKAGDVVAAVQGTSDLLVSYRTTGRGAQNLVADSRTSGGTATVDITHTTGDKNAE